MKAAAVRVACTLCCLGSLLATTGCKKDAAVGDCPAGCAKVYDECQKSLTTTSGASLTKEQCLSLCDTDPQSKTILECISQISGCDEAAGDQCMNGSSGGGDCNSWCATIYDQCTLYLTSKTGQQIDKAGCISACGSDAASTGIIQCMGSVSGCDTDAMNKCLNQTSNGPKMGHTYSPPPQCLSCHAAGTSSNAKKVPASHAGRTNDTCPTCHSAGQ